MYSDVFNSWKRQGVHSGFFAGKWTSSPMEIDFRLELHMYQTCLNIGLVFYFLQISKLTAYKAEFDHVNL